MLDKLSLNQLYYQLEVEEDHLRRKKIKNEIIKRTRERVQASRGTD